MSDSEALDDAQTLAESIGITLSAENLRQIIHAKSIADRALAQIRRDLPMSEEPATVFCAASFARS
jgi:hypothetical protein